MLSKLQVEETQTDSSHTAQKWHFNKQMMTGSTKTHADPLIQMFDTTDAGVPHELRMLVGHRHETWTEEVAQSQINLIENTFNTNTNMFDIMTLCISSSSKKKTHYHLFICLYWCYFKNISLAFLQKDNFRNGINI